MSLKHKIIKNPQLYKFFVVIGNLRYFFANSKSISGKNNSVKITANVLRKNVSVKISGQNNNLIIKQGCRFKNLIINIAGNNNTIFIDEQVMVYESGIFWIEGDSCTIHIDKKTTVGSAKLYAAESNTSITIGSDCMLSRDIRMNTSDFHSIISTETNKRINPPKNIVIKDHVWIGNNAYISKGAVINNDTIVASRAFVTGKTYQANTVIAGIPAKELNTNVTWSREKLPY